MTTAQLLDRLESTLPNLVAPSPAPVLIERIGGSALKYIDMDGITLSA